MEVVLDESSNKGGLSLAFSCREPGASQLKPNTGGACTGRTQVARS